MRKARGPLPEAKRSLARQSSRLRPGRREPAPCPKPVRSPWPKSYLDPDCERGLAWTAVVETAGLLRFQPARELPVEVDGVAP